MTASLGAGATVTDDWELLVAGLGHGRVELLTAAPPATQFQSARDSFSIGHSRETRSTHQELLTRTGTAQSHQERNQRPGPEKSVVV